MFVLGFVCGIAFLVGVIGLVMVATKPWRLKGVCDSILSAPRSAESELGYPGPLKPAV
jgi:hypothetical protein